MVTTKLNLSMTEPQVRQIYAKQGDTGRVLDITLDQTPEDGTLRILRPDGTEVTSEAVTGGEVSESGETVTFESMTEADVTELTVGIEPVQDLNGYDAPWVGGAGKNIIGDLELRSTTTTGNVTATLQSDGSSYALSGTASALTDVYLFSSSADNFETGSYYMYAPTGTGLNGATTDYFYIAVKNGTNPAVYYGVGGNNSATAFTLTEGDHVALMFIRVASGVNATGKIVTPMIVKGTTAPTSYSPYSNICPITGHDEVTVTRTGINLWDEEWEGGTINTSTGVNSDVGLNTNIRSTNFISALPSTEYYFCRQNFNGNIFEYDNSKNFIRVVASPTTFTTTANTRFLRFYMGTAYGNTYNHDISINYPSTDHDYHAYQGSTYTTSLGQTVYGGTLDLVSGVLTVDRAEYQLSDMTASLVSGNRWFFTSLQNVIKIPPSTSVATTTISDRFVAMSNVEMAGTTNIGMSVNAQGNLVVRNGSSTDQPTGQIVIPLATPVEYQLTAQQIKTLVGTNNVWASSGQIINITFTYGGLLSELPSEATEIVGKCYCDVEQNGVSSMPFTLNVKRNERQ